MSPEALEELIFTAKPAKFREAVAGLDEKTRRSLSKTAQSAYSSLSRNKAAKGASKRITEFVRKRKGDSWAHWDSDINQRAALALFAVAPLSGVKKQTLFVHGEEPRKAMFRILEDRRPNWLGDWVAWKLQQEFHHLKFDRIYGWIKNGLMEKPDTPEYYALYIEDLDVFVARDERYGMKAEGYVPLSKRLRKDPLLLADALSVFTCENGALQINSWRADKAHPSYQSWGAALIALAETGDIQRETLLDKSLESLSEDLKSHQLSGNHNFHRQLNPSEDEIFARQDRYRELLTHPVGHVVKFALAQMTTLDKANRLDRREFLSELPMIFHDAGIGNAKSALRLAGRIAKSEPKLQPAVLTAIIPALNHKDPGLQDAALKLIESYSGAMTSGHEEEISRTAEFLAASLRLRALKLIGRDSAEGAIETSDGDWDEVLKEVQGLAEATRKTYGLNGLVQEGSFSPSLISEDFLKLRVLHLAQPLSPIETHDDLFRAIARSLETVETAVEVELIADGISRLGRNMTPSFAARLKPLLTRMTEGGGNARGIGESWNALGHGLRDLVETWMTGKIIERNTQEKYYPHNRAAQPMIAHLNALAHRVVAGTLQPRLCTPTHEGGWIDPRIWVARTKDLIASGQKVDIPDLCYSMLRLAPDYREDAAAEIDALPQPWRSVGRFLFGLDDRPDLSVKTHPVIWISAARARGPFANWTDVLSDLHITETAPDGLKPASYSWKTVTTISKPKWALQPRKRTDYRIKAAPNFAGQMKNPSKAKTSLFKRLKPKMVLTGSALPTACLALNLKSSRWNASGWMCEWMTSFWPQNPTSIYARASYAFSLEENASLWSVGYGYLHPLFQPNRPWGEIGHLVIARGLAAKNADIRGYVIDALIEGAETGQFDPKLLASILEKMILADGVKLGRVTDGMGRTAEVSPLHAALISICLSALLPALDPKTHAFSRLMELWLESLAAAGRTPDSAHVTWLSSFKGASKSAKAAKAIKALTENPALNTAIKIQAVQSRLAVLPLS